MQRERLAVLISIIAVGVFLLFYLLSPDDDFGTPPNTKKVDPTDALLNSLGMVFGKIQRDSSIILPAVFVLVSVLGFWWVLRKPENTAWEPFLREPRVLTRTIRAPMPKWKTIFRLRRTQSPHIQEVSQNQLIIRNPKMKGYWNIYRFNLSQDSGRANTLTIGRLNSKTGKLQTYKHGEELEALHKRLPVLVRIQRPRALDTLEIQISTTPDAPKAIYECVLQSRDGTIRFQALQPR